MSRARRKGRAAAAPGELALDGAIMLAAGAVAILVLSTLLRVVWPGSAGAGLAAAGGRSPAATSGLSLSGGSARGAGGLPRGAGGAGGAPALAAKPDQVIRVQVLNGCGVGGAGASMASLLRRAGDVDVLEIGNADRFDFESTIVLDRTGQRAAARRVARLLGDPPVLLQRALEERFDVTVIVGYDQGRWLGPAARSPSR